MLAARRPRALMVCFTVVQPATRERDLRTDNNAKGSSPLVFLKKTAICHPHVALKDLIYEIRSTGPRQ